MGMNVNADEIITQKHKRHFIQFNGANPENNVLYAGQGSQYMILEGVTLPESGGIDPIYVPDPNRIGKFKMVGRTISPPDMASATLILRELHGSIPWQLFANNCPFTLFEVTGSCKDPSDFIGGWTDYVFIYSQMMITDKDMGSRSAWDGDDPIEDSISVSIGEAYPVGILGFGEGGSTQVDLEILDIAYGGGEACGECGIDNDGAQWIYAVTKSSGGSPGLPSELIYSVNGGLTWNQANIDGIGAAEDAIAIDVAGNYIIVLGTDAYYYAEINTLTGIPSTFTKVSTGFDATYSPNDLYVASPREVFFCGDGGYIYKSTNITAGVTAINEGDATTENLNRIHGKAEIIIAVGDNGAVVKSMNRGATWNTTTANPSTDNLLAVAVVTSYIIWVGTDAGEAYYSINGGESWTEKPFSGSGAGGVYDIVFVTNEVGYMSHSNATPTGYLFWTINGGYDWHDGMARIPSFPTVDRINRIAIPNANSSVACNNVAVGGLAGDGADGVILVGVASKF